jgi:hypothetical protein
MGAGERFVLLKLLLLFNFNFLRKRKVKQQSKLITSVGVKKNQITCILDGI